MVESNGTARAGLRAGTGLALALALLGGCSEGQMPGFLKGGGSSATSEGQQAPRMVERDIEAPEIFQATEAGLWDGRPSLGGVWVAHPDVTEPERVIIRNESNGQFVIGALFRRERMSPGPALQVSSDAAAAIGMLAGQPVELNVVALRREETAEDPAALPAAAGLGEGAMPEAPDVTEAPLDPAPAAAAPETAPEAADLSAPPPVAAPPAPRPASALARPYVQIGIFSVEQNAENTADSMRQAGMVPEVRRQESSGKTFWRVLVGPAQTQSDLDAVLAKIKEAGFTDAYAVTN